MTSTITAQTTTTRTFNNGWGIFGRYDVPGTQLAITGADGWPAVYSATGGPSTPDVGYLELTASAPNTGDVVLEHVANDRSDVPWLETRSRVAVWVRMPDVVPAGLTYSLELAVVVEGEETGEVVELYRNDQPAPGWQLVEAPWVARDDTLYAALRVRHRWSGAALAAGDIIGLAAGMQVSPDDWTGGYFDGRLPDTYDRVYRDEADYSTVEATFQDTATPDLILDYAYDRAAPTIVHAVIGSAAPDVTLRPVGLRRGVLVMFFLTRAGALELEELHRSTGVLTLDASDDEPTASMTYVVTGSLATSWDAQFDRWTVTAGYQEVAG